MKNIFEIYENIFLDKLKWKYYTDINVNPFDKPKKFIKEFIKLARKNLQNPLYDEIDKLDAKRARHIVSTFFFGIYLYDRVDKIGESIDVVINRYKKQNPKSTISFSFIWFLISLFHDLGYSIENSKKYNSFDAFIGEFKVKYFLKQHVGVPVLYEHVYENYFNYRLNSDNEKISKPDHGICGGLILFNTLNATLLERMKEEDAKNSTGLYWGPKLLNIYRYASWVVLSHNIYFITEGDADEQIYRDNNLEELILDKHEPSKIKLAKHSFLFLLSLVDNIEPVKVVDSFENCGKVKCSIDENIIRLKLNDDIFTKEYLDRVDELKSWLISENNIQIDRELFEIQIKINK